METLKEEHDRLLAQKPDDAVHDEVNCIHCNEALASELSPEGGDDMTKTFTEEDVNAAVAEAVQAKQAEIDALKASQVESEVEARIAAAKAEADEEITSLKAEVDAAVLKATNAEQELANVLAYFEGEKARLEAEAEIASRVESRRSVIKEFTSFKDDYIDANIDRWSALDEEAFAALVEDWKNLSSASVTANVGSVIPASTAMAHTREKNGESGAAAVTQLFKLTRKGVDVKSL